MTPTQVKFANFLRIPIFKDTYSFKLGLVDLTGFPDLILRLAKIKPFAKVCIYQIFHGSALRLLLSYIQ